MASFLSALKRFFGGGGESKAVMHQRFCLSCQKITPGALAPKNEGQKQAMDFTCSSCGGHTQVLQ
jgi:hypothetical protein